MYGKEALRSFSGELWTVSEYPGAGLNRVDATEDFGLSFEPGRINTNLNSGTALINLVALWGVAKIVLLGYDMMLGPNAETHHHGNHEGDLPNLGTLPEWVDRLQPVARDLVSRGIVVMNASRRTAIECIPRQALSFALSLSRPSVYLSGMKGLGDNIYQRSLVRLLARDKEVFLQTPWPQLYKDLPAVHCVKPETKLRTQLKNIRNSNGKWAPPPPRMQPYPITYAGNPGTMIEALARELRVELPERLKFDLPPLFINDKYSRPYVVVRPATLRSEWRADSRNPLPEYLYAATTRLRKEGFLVISVADLEWGMEWMVGPEPFANISYHQGELNVEQLLALVAGAAAVIGGVGWLVPAAIALQVPMFLVYGGWGADNGPARIFDERINSGSICSVFPTRFCGCSDRGHTCDKKIDDFEQQLDEWVARVFPRK